MDFNEISYNFKAYKHKENASYSSLMSGLGVTVISKCEE
jgi:hypothetical protein